MLRLLQGKGVRNRLITLGALTMLGIVLMFTVVSMEASAEESVQEQLQGEVNEELDKLDLSTFEQFAAELDSTFFGEKSLKEFISALTRGESGITPRTVLEGCFSYLTKGASSVLPSLLSIVLIAVLFSLVFGMTSDFLNKQTTEIVYFVCYGAVIAIVVAMLAKTLMEVRKTVETLTGLMNGIYPPLLTLMTALGGGTTVAMFQPGLAFLCTVVANVITKAVIPLFIASVIFCIAGNLSGNVKLDKLQSTTRYLAKILLTVTFGGFITYITLSGLVSGMSDGISVRAAKYLVSSYVPILGGYIAQGFDLITAGLILVKNSLGICGIIAVIVTVLSPALKLVALTLGLKLTAGIIEPITDKRMSSFVNGIAECTRQLMGAVLGIGFVFVVTLMLTILTLNVI